MITLLRNCMTAMLLTLLFANNALAERLIATVDRSTVAENETFTLTVKYEDGSSKSAPDFTPISSNFDILGNNQSSQYMNNNGRITNFTQWTLTLAPKQAGKALIPPLSIGKTQSRPITMTITKAQDLPRSAKVVFMETDISTQEVYVQEEFAVTIKLFFKENITDVKAADFAVKGASIEELPRAQYQTSIGHSNYQVIELRFAVTPESSGQLNIPSYLWNIRTSNAPSNRFGMGSGRSTLHRLKTEEFNVTVKPRPPEYPAAASWLPAKSLTLSEAWSDNPPRFTVGEPVTRSITITARGLTGEQLPPITANLVSNDFKFYPDQPEISSDTDAQGKLGARKESMAIVPTRAGELTLPAIEITWWDTQSDKLQSAILPERTVTVAPARAKPEQSLSAVLPTSQLQPQAQTGETTVVYKTQAGYWPWLCGVLVVLNLIQLGLWLKRLQQRTNNQDAKAATPQPHLSLKAVIQAAKNNDAAACRQALAKWCRHQSHSANNARDFFAQNGGSKALLSAIDELDAHLYQSTSNSWNGGDIASALQGWKATQSSPSTSPLPALYPA